MNQIKFGVVFSYLNSALSIIVSLVYTPFLLRMLGQAEYGLFSIAFSVIGLFSIMDLGFGNANIRYTAKYLASGEKDKERTLHGMFIAIYLVIGVIALLVGMLAYSNAQSIFGKGLSAVEIVKLRAMLLFVVISVSLSFPLSIFGFIVQGYEKFVFAKLTELLRLVMIPVVAVTLLLNGIRSVGIIAGISVINVLILIWNMLYCVITLKVKIDFGRFDKKLLVEILGYSMFVFLGVISYRINNSSNQFILGIVSGSVQVAIYGLAFNLIINFTTLATAISSLFLPAITKIPNDDHQLQTYNNYFLSVGSLEFYVLSLFFLGFVFFGKQFIRLWAGDGYDQSYYISLLLMSVLSLYLVQTIGKSILEAQNKHRYRSIVLLAMSLVSIMLSSVLSRHYGAVGAAISLAACWLIGNVLILNVLYARQLKLEVTKFWTQIVRITPAFIPAAIFSVLYVGKFGADTWVKLGLGLAVYTIIYCLSVMLFSFNRFERDLVLTPLARIVRIGSLKRG